MQKKALQAAFSHTIPVLTGYLFLGFAYGLLMRSAGFPLWVSAAMSAFVYAGSMQYAALPLLGASFAPFSALVLALLVNARHIFYGVSMLERYRGLGKRKAYLVFALTDETFSVNVSAQVPSDVRKEDFYAWVSLLDQCYWLGATVLGALFGEMLTFNIRGIEFVMTALFVVIFTGQWLETREHRPALIGVGASALCLVLFGAASFILPAMACIIVLLAMKQPLNAAQTEQAGQGKQAQQPQAVALAQQTEPNEKNQQSAQGAGSKEVQR